MANNIPRVTDKGSQKKFFDAVKEDIDMLMGRFRNKEQDRALTVRDLERLTINGKRIDLDRFLNCDRGNPYPL